MTPRNTEGLQDTNGPQDTIRVFYNSACPVCDSGIKSQQRKTKTSDCTVSYQDVHLDNQLVKQVNAPLAFVRERLHVVDENQQVQVGLDAFITIWRHSPNERWKATLLGLPGIHGLGVIAYNGFARLLYRWNKKHKRWE